MPYRRDEGGRRRRPESATDLGRVFTFEGFLRIRTFGDYKIEGMELVPGTGGIIFATDDENFGGWVLHNW